MKKRILSMLMLLVMILLCGFITVKASTEQTQDGISVSIKTDKDSYTKDEPIQVDIIITNTNSYDINDLYVKKLLPEGVKLEEGIALEEEIDILRAGEQKICQATAYVDDSFFGHEEEESSEASSDSEKESTPTDNNSVGSTEENSSEVNHSVSSNNVQPVNTEKIQISPEIITPTANVVPTADKERNLEFTPEVIVNKNTLLTDEDSNVEITGELYEESSEDMNSETQVSETVTDKEEHVSITEDQNALAESVDQEEKNSNTSKIILIVVIIILVICVLVIFRKGQGNKALSILLCASIITPIFAQLTVNAQELIHRRTVSAEKIIYIDSKEVTIQAEISFVIPEKEDNSSSGDSDDKEEVVFADGVIVDEISQQKEYELIEHEDGSYTVIIEHNEATSLIKEGSTFVLPQNEQNMFCTALVAKDINQKGQKVEIICEKPESMNNVVKSIDIESTETTVDYNNIKILSEGVTLLDQPMSQSTYGLNRGRETHDGNLDFSDHSFSLNLANCIDKSSNVSVNGTITFFLPEIYAKIDADFDWFNTEIHELKVLLTEKKNFDIGVNCKAYSNEKDKRFSKELLEIPIKVEASGIIKVKLVVLLEMTITGNFYLSFSIEETKGFEYRDGKITPIYSIDNQSVDFNAVVSGNIGPTLKVKLVFCEVFDAIGVNLKIVFSLSWMFECSYDNVVTGTFSCGDLQSCLYFIAELDKETELVKILNDKYIVSLTYKFEILNKEGEPLVLKWHFENGKHVEKCRFKEDVDGYISNAYDGTPIAGIKLLLKGGNDDVSYMTTTDENGYFCFNDVYTWYRYSMENLSSDYKFFNVNCNENSEGMFFVKKNQPVHLNYEMIPNQEIGSISASIHDGITGREFNNKNLDDAKITVRKGWYNVEGNIFYEGPLKNEYTGYIIALPKGKYTITVSANGYMDYIENINVFNGVNIDTECYLIPTTDMQEDSIVMVYAQHKFDFYSVYMVFNNEDKNDRDLLGSGNKYIDESGDKIAQIAGVGIVNSILYKPKRGNIYSFYVNIDDNTASGFDKVDYSLFWGDNVKIYKGGKIVKFLNLPYQSNRIYHVFDYDATTEQIIIREEEYDWDGSHSGMLDIYFPNKQKVALLSENLLEEQLLEDESVIEENSEEENISEMESVEEDYNTTEEIEETEITSDEVSEDESCNEETTEEVNAEEESEEVTLSQPLTEEAENYKEGVNEIE